MLLLLQRVGLGVPLLALLASAWRTSSVRLLTVLVALPEQVVAELLCGHAVQIAADDCIHGDLLLLVVVDDLDHEVRVGLQSELLVPHVNIGVAIFKVFVFFACEKAVVLALILNLVDVLHLESLLND